MRMGDTFSIWKALENPLLIPPLRFLCCLIGHVAHYALSEEKRVHVDTITLKKSLIVPVFTFLTNYASKSLGLTNIRFVI